MHADLDQGKTLKNQIKMAALYQRPLSSILLIYASELKRIPLSGIFTPGHTRSPSRSSHRAPICAPSPMTQFLIRAFAPIRTPCPMMESSSTAPGSIVTPSNTTTSSSRQPAPTSVPRPMTVPPNSNVPSFTNADSSTSDSPVRPTNNGDGAMPRTKSELPRTKSPGVPMSRQ